MILTHKDILSYILPHIEKVPVNRIILFGSYARGDADEQSDVDLIIDGGDGLTALDFFGIVGKVSKNFPKKFDMFAMDEIKNPSNMLDNINKEGVVLYDRNSI